MSTLHSFSEPDEPDEPVLEPVHKADEDFHEPNEEADNECKFFDFFVVSDWLRLLKEITR